MRQTRPSVATDFCGAPAGRGWDWAEDDGKAKTSAKAALALASVFPPKRILDGAPEVVEDDGKKQKQGLY